MIAATQTVAEIALEQPMAIPVFERYGIEYCCGGRMSLAGACEVKDLAIERVVAALEAASCKSVARTRNWPRKHWRN
jgi:regulator of cell morphogenesis and NO signaling